MLPRFQQGMDQHQNEKRDQEVPLFIVYHLCVYGLCMYGISIAYNAIVGVYASEFQGCFCS